VDKEFLSCIEEVCRGFFSLYNLKPELSQSQMERGGREKDEY
jgi:hypothetical protein